MPMIRNFAVMVDTEVIATNDATVARAWSGLPGAAEGYVEVIRSAKRHPLDSRDDDIGSLLATGRALQALGAKMERLALSRAKHSDDVKAHRRSRRSQAVEDKAMACITEPVDWTSGQLVVRPMSSAGS